MTPALAQTQSALAELAGLDAGSFGAQGFLRACRRRWTQLGMSPDEWVAHTRRSPAELVLVVESLLVGETWFAREVRSFELLQRHLAELPPSRLPVPLLSMGCATGEEAWTMAAAAVTVVDPARVRVDALDYSRPSLARAVTRTYPSRSVRGPLPTWLLPFLFREQGNWEVSSALADHVRFQRLNAMHADLLIRAPGRPRYRAVFCRNMLLYLHDDARERVIDAFLRVLAPGGLLVVAASEANIPGRRGLQPLEPGQPVFVVDGEPRSDPGPPRRSARGVSRRLRPFLPAAAGRLHRPAVAGKGPPSDLDRARAALAAGDPVAAERVLRRVLNHAGPSAEVYFLLGTALSQRGEDQQAVAFWRRATFVEPDHLPALRSLVQAMNDQGRTRRAAALQRRADSAAERHKNRTDPGTEGEDP